MNKPAANAAALAKIYAVDALAEHREGRRV
jgi:hypothetical protein